MDVAKQQEVHGLHAFSPRMNLTAAEQVRAEDSDLTKRLLSESMQ